MTLLHSVEEAAQQLRVSRSTVKRLINARSLLTVSIGQRRLVTNDSLVELASNGCRITHQNDN